MAVSFQLADEAALQPASTKLLDRMERLPMSRWHLKARAIIGTATFFDGFDSLAIGMVLPVIAAAWKMTPGEVGWLISGGFLGQMIGAIGFGQLAERVGRIPAIMITTAVFALGGIASAFAWGFLSMQVIRFVQGLGLGAEVPIAAAYINEIAPAERRGRFVLLYEILFAIGLLLAGVIGRWIIPAWGWQSLFLIGSVPPLIAVLLIPTLPESPRWLIGRGRLDAASNAVDRIENAIIAEGRTLPPPEQKARPAVSRPGHWRELFSPQYRTRTLVMWAIWLTVGFISWPLTIWLPTIYARVFHVPLETALSFGMYNNFIIIAGAIACALLIDFTGRRVWFAGALFIASLALIVLGVTGGEHGPERLPPDLDHLVLHHLAQSGDLPVYAGGLSHAPARRRLRYQPRVGPGRRNDRAAGDRLGHGRQSTRQRLPRARRDCALHRGDHRRLRGRDPQAGARRSLSLIRRTSHVRFVGTDIGGTFTDLVGFDAGSGQLFFGKTLTDYDDFVAGVMRCFAEVKLAPAAIEILKHGTTQIINTLLERRGARTAIVTTAGFRDVLEIGRASRPIPFDLDYARNPPLVPRHLRFEVKERIDAHGDGADRA